MTDRGEYDLISDMSRKVTTDRVTNLYPRAGELLVGMMPGCVTD